MKYWISTFSNYIESLAEDELSDWMLEGLLLFHNPESKEYQRTDLAFNCADYAFGQMGDQRSVIEELLDVYKHLQSIAPLRFDKAVARAIDRSTLVSLPEQDTFRSLIEIALEIRSSQAIESLSGKLCLIEPKAIDIICADLVYFLYEGHDHSALLKLGEKILNVDYPDEISATLLIGLMRLDPTNTLHYIKMIAPKLKKQVDFLKSKMPKRYVIFKEEFLKNIKVVFKKNFALHRIIDMSYEVEEIIEFTFSIQNTGPIKAQDTLALANRKLTAAS